MLQITIIILKNKFNLNRKKSYQNKYQQVLKALLPQKKRLKMKKNSHCHNAAAEGRNPIKGGFYASQN